MTRDRFDDKGRPIFAISPSDLTFLLHDCLRCFCLKVVHGVRRPITLPAVFNLFDRRQKDYFLGKPTTDLSRDLPAGLVLRSDVAVRSTPIPVPRRSVSIEFRGTLDALLAFPDGSSGVVDLKTAQVSPKLADFYAPQLHAYALALENPAPGWPCETRVNTLGLVCCEPGEILRLPDGRLAYGVQPTWIPIPRDDQAFFTLLMLVGEILEWTELPKPRSSCRWCELDRFADLVAAGIAVG